jgi:hypothetical protein
LAEHERAPVGYLLRHLGAGAAGSAVFGGLILGFDFAGLRQLIAASPDGVLVTVMLFFGLFVTFGGVALAIGVMTLDKEPRP